MVPQLMDDLTYTTETILNFFNNNIIKPNNLQKAKNISRYLIVAIHL